MLAWVWKSLYSFAMISRIQAHSLLSRAGFLLAGLLLRVRAR